ncbi:hypothetical protein L1887_59882 [Cichorium endivia]|nr:hypothetical protein L1887_59882 [Cichorium endivia]
MDPFLILVRRSHSDLALPVFSRAVEAFASVALSPSGKLSWPVGSAQEGLGAVRVPYARLGCAHRPRCRNCSARWLPPVRRHLPPGDGREERADHRLLVALRQKVLGDRYDLQRVPLALLHP